MLNETTSEISLGKKLITKSFWIYFFLFFIAPAGYFIKAIVSNKLSVEDVGLFYSILGFINVLSLYNDFGLTEALQYFIPQYLIRKEHNKTKTLALITRCTQGVSGILIASILYFASDRLAAQYFHTPEASNLIKLFCIYFFGINFIQALTSLFLALQDTFNQSIVEFVKNYVVLSFTTIFWITGTLTLYSFTLAWLWGIGISLGVGFLIFMYKRYNIIIQGSFIREKKTIKSRVSYAWRVFLGANAGTLLTQANQQMVMVFLGSEQAGYYTNYHTLFMTYGVIVGPILALLFPIITELIAKKEFKKLTIFQNILYKYFLIFAVSMSGLFGAFGTEIAAVLFGTKFAYSGTLIAYSSPFLVLNMLLAVNYSIMAGMGKIKERVYYLTIALCANLITNILCILVFELGVISAIISNCIARSILRRYSFKIINSQYPIHIDRYFLGRNTSIIIGITTILAIYKENIFIMSNNARFENIIYLMAIGICYYGILALFNTRDIKNVYTELRNIIRK